MQNNQSRVEIDLTEDIPSKLRMFSNMLEANLLERKYNVSMILVKTKGVVDVIFPDRLYAIGSLAFSTLFEGAFRRLGEEAFRKKTNFICSDIFMNSVNDCIEGIKDTMKVREENVAQAFIDKG